MNYERAIFGDNQFLGVDHTSQANAAKRFEQFKKPDAIIDIISVAYESDVRDFMFTTHDRYDAVFDEIRRSNLFPGMYYTPCIPYAHKYWNRLAYQSLPKMIGETLLQVKPTRLIPAGLGLLAGRTKGLVECLVEIEVLMCKGLPVKGVFLLNIAFDMLMAIEAYREIEGFANVIINRLHALPGFITMNHPMAVEVLCNKIGLSLPWICANYNLEGFRMNPSKVDVDTSFSSGLSKNIAMSVFSGSNTSKRNSLDHVISKLSGGGVDSILFGSSSPAHIRSNSMSILEGTNKYQ